MKINKTQALAAIDLLLKAMGVDGEKEPYLSTPERYYGFLKEMFGGDGQEVKTFPEEFGGLITIRGHEVWTLCPHHLLPVGLVVDVSYKPRGVGNDVRVLGLSKLPRLIDKIVRRGPDLQERITQAIVDALMPYSDVVSCVVRGEHLCAKIRGVKSTGTMVTEVQWRRPQPSVTTIN